MATKSYGKGITHRKAVCTFCSWDDEDPAHAPDRARRHTEQTGHHTTVESAHVIHYAKVKTQ